MNTRMNKPASRSSLAVALSALALGVLCILRLPAAGGPERRAGLLHTSIAAGAEGASASVWATGTELEAMPAPDPGLDPVRTVMVRAQYAHALRVTRAARAHPRDMDLAEEYAESLRSYNHVVQELTPAGLAASGLPPSLSERDGPTETAD